MTDEANQPGRANPKRDDLFRLLVESVRDYAIFLLDPHGVILTWNEGARRINGYETHEIIGKHFSIFFPPQEVKRGKPDYELRVAAIEGRWEEEGWRIRKDGTRFWSNVVITALFDPTGELVGYAKVTRDLSERKQAEDERGQILAMERAARRQTEGALERLRALQSVTEAALVHLDLDDLLRSLLDKTAELLAVDTVAVLLIRESDPEVLVARAAKGIEEEVEQRVTIPLDVGFAGRVAAQRRPIIIDDVARADIYNPILRQKGLQSLLGVPLVVQGRVIGVLHVGSLTPRRFSEDDSQLLQIVGDRIALAIDHTRLIETARAAEQEARVAEATLRAQDEFLSIAAHELKTPMTSLRIAAQLLLRRLAHGAVPELDSLQQSVEMIDRQSRRLARLVTQLLETVRLHVDRLELQRAPTNLTDLLTETIDQMRPQTARHEFILSVPGPVTANIDALRLEQVVTNLLDNAVKFSPDGGSIEIELQQPTPQTARVSVRDHGIGVPPERRPRLFERFYQAHASEHRSGMGLGLYITQQIVSMHGGSITADFPSDGGTRFIIDLPTQAGDIEHEAAS
jgi:PAS domain S-box-containing protein